MIRAALRAGEHWRDTPPAPEATSSCVGASLAVAQQVGPPDLSTTPAGTPTLRPGVAAQRRLSVEEAVRRHGRKSRSLRVDGYQRHGLRDLDSRLIVAVGDTPANAPAARVTDAIATGVVAQQCTLRAWPMDRASL